jgi:hypothetical protein
MHVPDDRPRWARVVHAGCLLELIGLVCLWTWKSVANEALWALCFPALCAVALLGLWRRVAWGRFLFSAISLLLTLVAVAVLIPNLDDPYEGGPAFERLFGVMPPLPLCWLMIVAAATLILAPAVAIGWRKHWFRAARW